MEEIIEAMAKAMGEEDAVTPWDELLEPERRRYRTMARAAYVAEHGLRGRMTAMQRAQADWKDWETVRKQQERDP